MKTIDDENRIKNDTSNPDFSDESKEQENLGQEPDSAGGREKKKNVYHNNQYGLNNYKCRGAKGMIDKFLHVCPNTRGFFDKNITLDQIPSRHEQKEKYIEEHDGKYDVSDASRSMRERNKKTIKTKRDFFNQFAQFAVAKYDVNRLEQVLTPRIMSNFIYNLKVRLEASYSPKTVDEAYKNENWKGKDKWSINPISEGTYLQYLSYINILGRYASNTEGYPDVDFSGMTDKAKSYAVKLQEKYKDEIEMRKSEGISSDFVRRPYTAEEQKAILDRIENPKERMIIQLGLMKGLRKENLCTIYPDTEWTTVQGKDGKLRNVRTYSEGNIAVLAKGGQRRNVSIGDIRDTYTGKLILEEIREWSSNGKFSYRSNTLNKNFRKACRELGMDATAIHNLRYTYACTLFRNLLSAGYDYNNALKMVSEALFHKRNSITLHYLRAELRAG